MSKLEKSHREFIRLVVRSPDKGNGWRTVSKAIQPFADKMATERPEFYEWRPHETPPRIRLTERGRILGEYL